MVKIELREALGIVRHNLRQAEESLFGAELLANGYVGHNLGDYEEKAQRLSEHLQSALSVAKDINANVVSA